MNKLKEFVKSVQIRDNKMWIVLDTGVNICGINNKIIFEVMENIAKDAIQKKININLIVDTKNISIKTFDPMKFASIQNYFAKNHIKIVDKIYIINSNSIFKTIQQLLNPLLDSNYKDKIQICDKII